MITVSGTLSKGWMAKVLGPVFDRDYYFNPDRRHAVDCQCNEYAADKFPGMRLFYSESNLGQIGHWDKQQVQIGGIQPNMILGMLLGADFAPQESGDADITPGCLVGKEPADLPSPEDLLNHGLIKLFDDQIHQVQNNYRSQLRPIPPFFWDLSGRATIHGVMTSAQKLLGESIFLDMLTDPRPIVQVMSWIRDAFILLCRHFSEIADLSITGVHVGECSAFIVSPELIRTFVAPMTSKIAEELGPVRLHSCGPSSNHLEAFSRITNLCALDLGGDTSVKRTREVFGKEMPISIAPLPRQMSAESADPILCWAQRVFEENSDGNLEYIYHLESDYNIETIYALTRFVSGLPGFGDSRSGPGTNPQRK